MAKKGKESPKKQTETEGKPVDHASVPKEAPLLSVPQKRNIKRLLIIIGSVAVLILLLSFYLLGFYSKYLNIKKLSELF